MVCFTLRGYVPIVSCCRGGPLSRSYISEQVSLQLSVRSLAVHKQHVSCVHCEHAHCVELRLCSRTMKEA